MALLQCCSCIMVIHMGQTVGHSSALYSRGNQASRGDMGNARVQGFAGFADSHLSNPLELGAAGYIPGQQSHSMYISGV